MMKIKFWGVRGSLPSPHTPEVLEARLRHVIERFKSSGTNSTANEFLSTLPQSTRGGFGGNTACVEIIGPEESLIIDAGSGIRGVGDRRMSLAGFSQKPDPVSHILFTHFHWDHLIGLPFFTPIFIPGNTVHMYAVQEDLEDCIRALFRKPFFPVPFEALGSKVIFHKLEPRKKTQIAGFDVTPYQLDHPDPCWGYRVEHGGKSYSHCVDTEGTRVSPDDIGPDLPLYQNSDLVLFDAQYTMIEAAEKMNWGHAAAPLGIEIALRENAKRILFAHHDPGASDEKIADAERQTREFIEVLTEQARRAGRELPAINWGFAYEGQEITL